MKKPRAIDFRYGYYNSAIDFMENILTSEEYIQKHNDSNNRNMLEWNELYILRSNMEFFGRFLQKFSVLERRLVLMNKEIIGFSQQELFFNFGINFDMIGRFLGKKEVKKRNKTRDPIIREVLSNRGNLLELAAYISMLARIPVEWLILDKPEQSWSTEHFIFLDDCYMKNDEFLDMIQSYSEDIHDVRGIILDLDSNERLYIRFEWIKGAFLIELFNRNASYSTIDKLRKLLGEYKFGEGLTDTVIHTQKNFTIICQNKSKKPICLNIPMMHF